MSDWTAVAGKSSVQTPGNVVMIVSLTHTPSGKTADQEVRYDGTGPSLIAAIRQVLPKLDGASGKPMIVEPGTVLDLSDPVPVPPTQAEQDRAVFFADWRLLQSYRRGISAGLLSSSDKIVTDLEAKAEAEFLIDYAGSL